MSRFPIWFTVALGVAVLFFLIVPFGAGTGTGTRLFFSILMGGLIAGGAAVLLSSVRDIAGLFRRREAPPPARPRAPPPELSPVRKTAVRRVVAVLAEQGVFAPEVPDPALFFPGVAEMDESVKPDTILPALWELDYYHPGTRPKRFMANLVMLDSKTEQEPAYLRKQVEDLARIAGVSISELTVDADWPPHDGPVPVRIAMQAGGSPLAIEYAGAVKYASSYIAHAIDACAGEVDTGRRLGWLWTDQGAWISALPDGAVEAMNAALKLTPQSRCCWEWVGDAAPMAAGDLP